MTSWDYGRVRSLADSIVLALEGVQRLHSEAEPQAAPWDEIASLVNQADRDLATIKALLKRERSKRA